MTLTTALLGQSEFENLRDASTKYISTSQEFWFRILIRTINVDLVQVLRETWRQLIRQVRLKFGLWSECRGRMAFHYKRISTCHVEVVRSSQQSIG